jgi:hypothetical protein
MMAILTRLASLVILLALAVSPSYAADYLSGTWSSGDSATDRTFVFRVQGDSFVGIVCAKCDDPASLFRVADGRILDSGRIQFFIVHDDGGLLFAKVGPYREEVTGTLAGTRLTLQTKREGTGERATSLVLNRVTGQRGTPPAAARTTAPAASAIDGRWVSVGRVAQQNLTLKIRGNTVSGVICGPCDDPSGVFLVEDGKVDGTSISFYIHHFDAPPGADQASGLRRNFMKGTITGNIIRFTWVREGRENEPGGEMLFTGPLR